MSDTISANADRKLASWTELIGKPEVERIIVHEKIRYKPVGHQRSKWEGEAVSITREELIELSLRHLTPETLRHMARLAKNREGGKGAKR